MFASKDVSIGQRAAYPIARSVRFRASASAYLSRTPTVASNRRTWTFSAWVKKTQFTGTAIQLFSAYSDINNGVILFSTSTEGWGFQILSGGSSAGVLTTSAAYRDPSAWYHVMIACDTTQATSSERMKIYVNGVQLTAFVSATYPTQNFDTQVNNAVAHAIAARAVTPASYFDCYVAEVNFIDGQALTPSSFGAFNIYGVWQPAKYQGTYGTNGFYLKFDSYATAAALGTDSSGNGNTWTVNNISVTAGATYDAMQDTPTLTSLNAANYATWNSVNNGTTNSYTFSNGNLSATVSAASGGRGITSTSGMSSTSEFKYYAELTVSAWGGSNNADVGILNTSTSVMTTSSFTLSGCIGSYLSNGYSINKVGTVYNNGTSLATGLTTFADGDIVQIAYDGTYIYFGKNGTWLNSAVPASGTGGYSVAAGAYAFAFGVSSNTSQTGTVIGNFGQRPFSYTPPTGFNALNTFSLANPAIPNGAAQMAATLYTGTGATQSIANTVNSVSFQPDFVWVKKRSGADNHELTNSVVGNNLRLAANTTDAQSAGGISVASNGFSLSGSPLYGTDNENGFTYVAWQWKAGTGLSTNTNGSITSTVNASTSSGFSIVTYTGTGANATVGHGLGVTPSFIIVKKRSSTGNWQCWHSTFTGTQYISLNLTTAVNTNTAVYNGSPTSTIFNIGTDTDVGASGATYVAYVFTPVAGYSAFGSYAGNSSTDGPFIYLGFKPRWVMIKNITTIGNWLIVDTSRQNYNVAGPYLNPNLSDAETTGTVVFDMLSNGFKCRSSTTANSSGSTYIYAAFAENPFKYALAR